MDDGREGGGGRVRGVLPHKIRSGFLDSTAVVRYFRDVGCASLEWARLGMSQPDP